MIEVAFMEVQRRKNIKIGRGIFDKERKKRKKEYIFFWYWKMKMQLKMGKEIIEGIKWSFDRSCFVKVQRKKNMKMSRLRNICFSDAESWKGKLKKKEEDDEGK